jgi:3-oxoisoapionate decarboxylase
MKLGINTYSFMWAVGLEGARPERPLTAMGLLERARALGVRLVQTGPNLPFDRLSPGELDEFIQAAREAGIELEVGSRGLEARHLKKQVALCHKMGSRLLRSVPEVGGQTPTLPVLAAHLQRIRPLLESEQIWLGLENHNQPANDLRSAIEVVGSPNIGVVLDTVNSLAVPEGWKEVTRILAPYTMCLHYKEFLVKRAWSMMGFTCEGRPAGRGQLDAPYLFKALKASQYDFNVVLEQWTPEQSRLEDTIRMEWDWAIESIAYLREFVKD